RRRISLFAFSKWLQHLRPVSRWESSLVPALTRRLSDQRETKPGSKASGRCIRRSLCRWSQLNSAQLEKSGRGIFRGCQGLSATFGHIESICPAEYFSRK